MSHRTIAAILIGVTALAGCASPTPDGPAPPGQDTTNTSPRPIPPPSAPSSVPEPHETDYPEHWDTPPDYPITADKDLTEEDLLAALRISATAQPHPDHCTANDVRVTIQALDAALGYRLGSITVTNTSTTPCTVQGYPGFGARGEWGNTFLLVAEQHDPLHNPDPSSKQPDTTQQPVIVVDPGGSAQANMGWYGELAGAYSEPISLFIVQLVEGDTPVTQPVTSPYSDKEQDATSANGLPAPNSSLDIGLTTSVEVGPFAVIPPPKEGNISE